MKYIKQTSRNTWGYDTEEITKAEAMQYVSEETLSHLYNDLIVTCGSSAAYEQVKPGLFIGVSL